MQHMIEQLTQLLFLGSYFCIKKKIILCQCMWPILEIGPLHLTHPSAHTQQWVVNTHCEHPEQWAAIIAPAPGEQLGVWCLAQGHLSHGIEGGESAVHSQVPTINPCRTWDSNPQPLDYKSDSLTIRPRLPIRTDSWKKRLFVAETYEEKECLKPL